MLEGLVCALGGEERSGAIIEIDLLICTFSRRVELAGRALCLVAARLYSARLVSEEEEEEANGALPADAPPSDERRVARWTARDWRRGTELN